MSLPQFCLLTSKEKSKETHLSPNVVFNSLPLALDLLDVIEEELAGRVPAVLLARLPARPRQAVQDGSAGHLLRLAGPAAENEAESGGNSENPAVWTVQCFVLLRGSGISVTDTGHRLPAAGHQFSGWISCTWQRLAAAQGTRGRYCS